MDYSINLSADQIRAVGDIVVRLVEIRAKHVPHLCVENLAPDLFRDIAVALSNERLEDSPARCLEYKGCIAIIHRSLSPPGGWGCRVRKGFDSYRIDGAKTILELQERFEKWVDAGMPSAAQQMAEISKKDSVTNHGQA